MLQNNQSADGNTSVNRVKGCESSHKTKLCNTSGNTPKTVVNSNRDGHLTPQTLGDEVLEQVLHSFTEGSATTSVNIPQHNSCNRNIAKVTGPHNLHSNRALSCQQSAVNSSQKVVNQQEVRVQTSERSYDDGGSPPQSQVIYKDDSSHNLTATVAAPYMATTNSGPDLCHPSTKNPLSQDNCSSDNSSHCKVFDINGLDEKYLAFILIQAPKVRPWVNSDNKMVQAWRDQTDFEFGFIPLSDLQRADTKAVNQLAHYCPIEAHKMVARYNKPNYLGARIRVDTQLNLEEWYDQLKGYWDQQLLDFLTFGFPLDFNRNSPLAWEGDNHKSAIDHPEDIEAYLQEEMDFKAIIGPFPEHPCDNGHISPFMTRDKPGSKHRRVIIDLSWPPGSSVNAGIDKASYMGTDFVLVLPTVDNITDQLKLLGRGPTSTK